MKYNTLVKITVEDDGAPVESPVWCVIMSGDTDRTLCKGEALDAGADYIYTFKTVKRGGITCDECRDLLLYFKSIRL